MLKSASPNPSTRQNLRRLCNLRFIAICGTAILVAGIAYLFALELPVFAIYSLLSVAALFNIITLWRLQRDWPVGEIELFAQLVVDVVMLTILFYLTGGPTNPFVMVYLVPLALTVASLPQRYTKIMFVTTSLAYGSLIAYQSTLALRAHEHDQVFSMHIIGMWFGYVLSAGMIAWFGVKMVSAVRERDAQLARMNEHNLRQEHIISLGALAAGAAHELGTPLATLHILADELKAGEILPTDSCHVLRDQVKRCKTILNSMVASSGGVRAISGGRMPLDEFLLTLLQDWQYSRPQARLAINSISGSEPSPLIVNEQTLTQAINNLLNNAADASETPIEVDCRWSPALLTMEIADRGTGLAPEVAQRAGQPFTTTKSSGLGLGLYLTFATLERLGGEIQLYNRDGGGTLCRLQLPLQSLSVSH